MMCLSCDEDGEDAPSTSSNSKGQNDSSRIKLFSVNASTNKRACSKTIKRYVTSSTLELCDTATNVMPWILAQALNDVAPWCVGVAHVFGSV